MQTLLDVILPVFLVIGFGYAAAWRGIFSESAVDAVMRFAQDFAIPCLLFRAIINIDISSSFQPVLLVSFYAGAVICFGLGYLGARRIFGRDIEDSIAIAFCCLFSNSVLLGLPISERAFGPEMLPANYAIIAFHAPFCYILGICAMELARARGSNTLQALRKVTDAILHNALVIGVAAGFAWNLLDLPMPAALEDGLSFMAIAALPTALFALGGVLFKYKPEGDTKTILMVCIISLFVHPALTYSFGSALSLPPESFKPAVLTAAVAPGFNSYIFAHMYGRARRVAASSVLFSTGATLITAWLWLNVLG